ncbi:hypothetical protein D3C84_824100 [compost metagenome]
MFLTALGKDIGNVTRTPLASAPLEETPHCSITYPVGLVVSGVRFQPLGCNDEVDIAEYFNATVPPIRRHWLLSLMNSAVSPRPIVIVPCAPFEAHSTSTADAVETVTMPDPALTIFTVAACMISAVAGSLAATGVLLAKLTTPPTFDRVNVAPVL